MLYALVDRSDTAYVGLTSRQPSTRLSEHVSHSSAKFTTFLHWWIIRMEWPPEIIVLGLYKKLEDGKRAERNLVRDFEARGFRLLNSHYSRYRWSALPL